MLYIYVGAISDVELTRVCGFLTKLEDKPGIAIMVDRGFTIKDMLKALNIELNIPPFLQERQQLSPEEIQEGRSIASLRIHVERAIGRLKTYNVCKGTMPLSLARLSNQIVCVCAFLTNLQPALVQCPTNSTESDTACLAPNQTKSCNVHDDYIQCVAIGARCSSRRNSSAAAFRCLDRRSFTLDRNLMPNANSNSYTHPIYSHGTMCRST